MGQYVSDSESTAPKQWFEGLLVSRGRFFIILCFSSDDYVDPEVAEEVQQLEQEIDDHGKSGERKKIMTIPPKQIAQKTTKNTFKTFPLFLFLTECTEEAPGKCCSHCHLCPQCVHCTGEYANAPICKYCNWCPLCETKCKEMQRFKRTNKAADYLTKANQEAK